MQHCALQALVTLLKALKGHAPAGDTPEWLLYQLRLVRTRPRLGSNAPPPSGGPPTVTARKPFFWGGPFGPFRPKFIQPPALKNQVFLISIDWLLCLCYCDPPPPI